MGGGRVETATEGLIAGKDYKVGKRLGAGCFGEIRQGINMKTDERVAVKIEAKTSRPPALASEYRYYKLLGDSPGVPKVFYFGKLGPLHYAMVMECLGPNLESLYDSCNRKFSLKTVAMIALQLLRRFEHLHSKRLIYRDVKPENFLIGVPEKGTGNVVYVVDMGLAKEYIDPVTEEHIDYFRYKAGLTGTARYMSVNTHQGIEQSRRDDLEALAYMFVYFMRGELPWSGLKAKTAKEKYRKIGEIKRDIEIETLCQGFPEEFATCLEYTRELDFYENPDYEYLKGLFTDILDRYNWTEDGVFDWTYEQEIELSKKSCFCVGLCRKCHALRLKCKSDTHTHQR